MANNTTFQRIYVKANAIVDSNGNITGQAAPALGHYETGGTFVANGTSAVTVIEPRVGNNSVIPISLKTVGGTVGAVPAIQTVTAGTGFTVKATASDTSTYLYLVIG